MKKNERFGRFVMAGLVGLAVGACGSDEPVVEAGDGTSTPLQVQQILVSPKTGSAGDTLLLTADVRSSSANPGDIPVMAWSATGGAFIEDDQLTVRWVAPATSDVYVVTARATNSVSSASGNTNILVAGVTAPVTNDAGAVTLISGGPDFYYRRSLNVSLGSEVFRFAGGVATDATPPPVGNNFEVVYAPDLSFEAHWADTVYTPVPSANRPRHIYVGHFGSQTFQRLTVDNAAPSSERRQQFTAPAISANNHLVAFQGVFTDQFNAAIDSYHVFIYDLIQNQRVTVTAGQPRPRNFSPTFSTDQNWLTFVSDPTATGRWEIYGAPLNGDVVDTDNANVVQMSSTGGSIASGSPGTFKPPLKTWNPVTSELAVVARDGTLYIVQTATGGGTTTEVTGLPGPALEMVWSPAGSALAVVPTAPGVGGAIYLVSGSSAVLLLTVPTGDTMRDLVWSPDEAWLVYRRTRGGVAWFELVDIDGGELSAPLAITGVWLTGNATAYRTTMSMSPAWGAGDQLWMPVFGVTPTSPRPGIIAVDISGAVQ